MSDLPVRPPQSAVDAAFKLFAEHRHYVRDLAHGFTGDVNRQTRDVLLAELFALDLLEERMLQELAAPVEGRREVGLTTDAWMAGTPGLLRRNRGPA